MLPVFFYFLSVLSRSLQTSNQSNQSNPSFFFFSRFRRRGTDGWTGMVLVSGDRSVLILISSLVYLSLFFFFFFLFFDDILFFFCFSCLMNNFLSFPGRCQRGGTTCCYPSPHFPSFLSFPRPISLGDANAEPGGDDAGFERPPLVCSTRNFATTAIKLKKRNV